MAKPTNQATTQVTKAIKAVYGAFETIVQGVQLKDQGDLVVREAFEIIRGSKVTIGHLNKKCAIAIKFRDLLCAAISPKTGQPYTAQVASNYLNAMRTALKTGNPLELNTSRKAKAEGQASTPKSKDKAKLTEPEEMATDSDIMATDEPKPASVKPSAFKSNEQAIEALQSAVKAVKVSCTTKQWQAIVTLYPNIEKLAD